MFDSDVTFGESGAAARKVVSGSEPFALGHYAGDPIFPGVLTLQLMLDLGGCLVRRETGGEPGRIRIVRAQYLDMVRPGDDLEVSASVKKRKDNLLQVATRVSAGDVVKTRATLEFEVEA